VIAQTQPELVHTCNLTGFGGGVWELARRRGLPVVHTLHDYHLLCPRVSLTRRDGAPCCPHPGFCALRTRRLARWAGAASDVIAGSEHLWLRVGPLFPHARSHVIRLPIVPVADRPLRPPGSPPRVVGFLGGLDRIKGVEPLLAAAPVLSQLGLTLRVAGDGRLRAAVESAAGAGLEYSGPVLGAAKVAFIEEVDLAVVPSTYEEPNGPTYVVAEWLAAGRPVLASDRGGLAEAHELPGVARLEPSAEGIVGAVETLIEERTWRETLAAIPAVKDARDLDRWLDAHERVYELAADARRSRTSA
jgi:glycosyltransferase involved in cell wall biosynthesis